MDRSREVRPSPRTGEPDLTVVIPAVERLKAEMIAEPVKVIVIPETELTDEEIMDEERGRGRRINLEIAGQKSGLKFVQERKGSEFEIGSYRIYENEMKNAAEGLRVPKGVHLHIVSFADRPVVVNITGGNNVELSKEQLNQIGSASGYMLLLTFQSDQYARDIVDYEQESAKANVCDANLIGSDRDKTTRNLTIEQAIGMLNKANEGSSQAGKVPSVRPEAVVQKRKPVMSSDIEIKIMPGHQGWGLCEHAESYFYNAIDKWDGKNAAVVLVNGVLLVKFLGKMTALCLQTTTTRNGQTFLEGNFYSPVDEDLRKTLKEAFDSGEAKIALSRGEWAFMRPLEFHGGLLEEVRKFTASLQDRLPEEIDGMTRRRWRLQYASGAR